MIATSRLGALAAAAGLGLACAAANPAPVELIANGGFEAGLASWSVTDFGSGSWYARSDGSTPNGFPTAGAAAGASYAVTDHLRPAAHVLEQAFTVPAGATSLVLGFLMFANDFSGRGPLAGPAAVDGLTPVGALKQHVRVDIVTAAAGAFSTDAADVVAGLVAPMVDAGANPHPYTAYRFDLTSLLAAGSTYRLRFGAVGNLGMMSQGVDGVSLLADVGAAVPEPATLALAGLALAGMAASLRRGRN